MHVYLCMVHSELIFLFDATASFPDQILDFQADFPIIEQIRGKEMELKIKLCCAAY